MTRSAAEPRLVEAEIKAFEAQGFLSIPDITTPEEIAWLREVCDRMFERKAGYDKGDYFDLIGAAGTPMQVPQITKMSDYEPALRDTQLWRNARAITRQIMGPDADYVFDHGIRKPPGGAATPWHPAPATKNPSRLSGPMPR